MFITTANQLEPIPAPLRDRMEIINLAGYTEREKISIANGFLIPRQLVRTDCGTKKSNSAKPGCKRSSAPTPRSRGAQSGTGDRLDLPQGSHEDRRGTASNLEVGPEEVAELLGRPHFFSDEEIARRTSVPAWQPAWPGHHSAATCSLLKPRACPAARASRSPARSGM